MPLGFLFGGPCLCGILLGQLSLLRRLLLAPEPDDGTGSSCYCQDQRYRGCDPRASSQAMRSRFSRERGAGLKLQALTLRRLFSLDTSPLRFPFRLVPLTLR